MRLHLAKGLSYPDSISIMSERPATRLYIEHTLSGGATIALDPGQAHKLRNVLRLRDGEAIAAFNTSDGEWLCRLQEQGKRGAALSVERLLRAAEPEIDIWLIFAPIKRARLDWLIEKATELGATALLPVWTERTQSERLNPDRLLTLAIAAAEQSERLSVPELADAQPLDRLLSTWPNDRWLIVCDETGGGTPVAEALAGMMPGQPAGLLVGPEGGFAERELDALGKLPIVNRVGLGPRVLRAETAALAVLAVFQAIAGDWGRVRPR
jgi:16S rRNA (uracil1498-N3)-methyltransferase